MQPLRRGLPAFYDNDTPASQHGTFELPYPAPEQAAVAAASSYVFETASERALWTSLTQRRLELCAHFRDGLLRVALDSTLSALVDSYAIDLFTLLEHYDALRVVVAAGLPPVFVWRSACDGLDYVSASPHFECVMAQLLAYVVHFNRLALWRRARLQAWERDVQPSETIEICRRRLERWHSEAPRDVCVQFMLTASARRCHSSLQAWTTLRAYTALRYPIELSREFITLLMELDTVWQDIDRHEDSVAGLLIYDETDQEQWLSAAPAPAPTTSQALVELTVRAAALLRAFQILPRWKQHASTLTSLSTHCERSALFARVYEHIECSAYEEAYACVLALFDTTDDDVVTRTTLERLRDQVLAAAALTRLRESRPTTELACAEAATRAVISLWRAAPSATHHQ